MMEKDGHRITQKRIAEAAGVGETSVRRLAKELREMLSSIWRGLKSPRRRRKESRLPPVFPLKDPSIDPEAEGGLNNPGCLELEIGISERS